MSTSPPRHRKTEEDRGAPPFPSSFLLCASLSSASLDPQSPLGRIICTCGMGGYFRTVSQNPQALFSRFLRTHERAVLRLLEPPTLCTPDATPVAVYSCEDPSAEKFVIADTNFLRLSSSTAACRSRRRHLSENSGERARRRVTQRRRAMSSASAHRPLLLEEARLVTFHLHHVANAATCSTGHVRFACHTWSCASFQIQSTRLSPPPRAPGRRAPFRGHSTLLWPYRWQMVHSAVICRQSRETWPLRPHLQTVGGSPLVSCYRSARCAPPSKPLVLRVVVPSLQSSRRCRRKQQADNWPALSVQSVSCYDGTEGGRALVAECATRASFSLLFPRPRACTSACEWIGGIHRESS